MHRKNELKFNPYQRPLTILTISTVKMVPRNVLYGIQQLHRRIIHNKLQPQYLKYVKKILISIQKLQF